MTVINLEPDVAPLRQDPDGVMRVAATRVTLDSVVGAFSEGATAEEIAQQYPAVGLTDVYAVIAFYLRRRADIDAYLRDREAAGAAVRSEAEARPESAAFRQRLLTRAASTRPR